MQTQAKNIYRIKLYKDSSSQNPQKLKFPISKSKNTIIEVKEELKKKLVKNKYLGINDEIILKDAKGSELPQYETVEELLPQQQKILKVVVKEMGAARDTDTDETSSVAQSVVTTDSLWKTVASIDQIDSFQENVKGNLIFGVEQFGGNQNRYLVDAYITPGRTVNPLQPAFCDENQLQLRFTCPQLKDPSIKYGIIIPKKLSYWNLSEKILVLFGLQKTNLKALLFSPAGVPMIWSMDYMGIMAENLNPQWTYVVIFTANQSTYSAGIPPPDLSIGKQKISVNLNGTQQDKISVNLETCTIEKFKQKVYHVFGIHPKNQLIKFQQKPCDNQKHTLKQLGVVEASTIDIIYNPKCTVVSKTFKDNFYNPGIKHVFKQTVQGLRRFRSNLFVTVHHLPANIQPKFLALVREFTKGNVALVTGLKALFDYKNICETQKIAIEEGLFCMFRDFMIRCKDFPKHYKSGDLFLATRQCLGFFLSAAQSLEDSFQFQQIQSFEVLRSYCQLVSEEITEPIYLTLDDGTRVITDKFEILDRIKDKTSVSGIDKLNHSLIKEDESLKFAYENFKRNHQIDRNVNLDIVQWKVRSQEIAAVKKYVDTLVLANPYTYYSGHMENIDPEHLKLFDSQELKTKSEYPYLLENEDGKQKIYLQRSKNIKLPYILFDVITGEEDFYDFSTMEKDTGTKKTPKGPIKSATTKQPAEAIAVLYDISSSMDEKFFKEPDLKRIGAVKSFFEAFADRTVAYHLEHVVSLILFNHLTEVKVDFTNSFQDFNSFVANTEPSGSTNLFDAMSLASDNLVKLKSKYPNVILRILALTDGQDTGSKMSIQSAAEKLIKNQIIIDSFVVGNDCQGLKTLTFAAGGRCYLIRSKEEGLKFFQEETILSSRARKKEGKMPSSDITDLAKKLKLMALKPFSTANDVYEFNVPQMGKPNISASTFVKQFNNPTKLNKVAPTNSLKRVFKQLEGYWKNPNPFVAVFPCPEICRWKILVYGRKQTLYEGGLFLLYAEFPSDYPSKAPEIRFRTPIYHCNISSTGKICHSIFERNYSPAVTFKNIVDAIYELIVAPEPNDPLDSVIGDVYFTDLKKYQKNAKQSTKIHANKSAEEIAEQVFVTFTDNIEREQKIQQIRQWLEKAKAIQ